MFVFLWDVNKVYFLYGWFMLIIYSLVDEKLLEKDG